MATWRPAAVIAGLAWAALLNAQEATVHLESKVIGNQEQPRVMVIVPWQDASASNDLFQEFTPRLQESGGLLERETFLRELEFIRQLDQPAAR